MTIASLVLALTTQVATSSVTLQQDCSCRNFSAMSAPAQRTFVHAYAAGVALGVREAGGGVDDFVRVIPGTMKTEEVIFLTGLACAAMPDSSVPSVIRMIITPKAPKAPTPKKHVL